MVERKLMDRPHQPTRFDRITLEAIYWYLMVVISKGLQFNGRSRRKEFWIFVLFSILFILGSLFLRFASFGVLVHDNYTETVLSIPLALYILVTLLPSLAVIVRRLHDTSKSGWMILFGLIPIVGFIILLVFMLLDSDPEPNQYGPNPKLELVAEPSESQ
jgi:uncharacterized membrane protein YhaH (DUF805 family)